MPLPNDGNCFRCGQPGHWIQHCPHATRAATPAEHQARIDRIVERWIAGAMATHQKRQLIREENELWKPKETTGARK